MARVFVYRQEGERMDVTSYQAPARGPDGDRFLVLDDGFGRRTHAGAWTSA